MGKVKTLIYLTLVCLFLSSAGSLYADNTGDLNGDGFVDINDLSHFSEYWLTQVPGLRHYPVAVSVAACNASPAEKASADFVCDGIDDQVEIMEAYAVLKENISDVMGYTGIYMGGKIVLSQGAFNCSDPIIFDGPAPLSLEGAGFQSQWPAGENFRPAGTVIRCADGMNDTLMAWIGNASSPQGWSCGHIKGIWFEGNSSEQVYANLTKRFNSSGYVESGGYYSGGIIINNRGDTYITNCMFSHFRHDYALAMLNHGSWIENCDIEDNANGDIYLIGERYFVTNNHIARNKADYNQPSILVYSKYFKCTSNNFQQNGAKVIDLIFACQNAIITGNTFSMWAFAHSSSETAIRFRDGNQRIIITNNVFHGNESAGGYYQYADYGIYADEVDDTLTDCIVADNIFYDIGIADLYLGSALTRCSIHDNTGDGSASIIGNKTHCNIHDNNFAGTTTISGASTNCNIHDNF